MAAEHPQAEISNGAIRAGLYLPDAQNGYYRGTRFDWSGMIHSLVYKGHEYYGPWYDKMDPAVHDFVYRDGAIVAGACSWATGPAEEFGEIGYREAAPGGTFVKIGVGRLQKRDAEAYDPYRLYEIADGGKWTVHTSAGQVESVQEVGGPGDYAYTYRKVVRLENSAPRMTIEHLLKNTGRKAIVTQAYIHNFLILQKPPGPGLTVTFPFRITSPPLSGDLARIEGNKIVYLKALTGEDKVQTPIEGFGAAAADYSIRIESRKAGAGLHITGDLPLAKASLWSIRSNASVEPFVAVKVEPGRTLTWAIDYEYFEVN